MHALKIIFFFLLTTCFYVNAQVGHPSFHKLGTAEGIPSPETYYAMQASSGKMWFGTDNGVFSYDGFEIKTYSKKDGLNNTVIFQISEDKNGNLWFNSMSGNVYIYLQKMDSIIPFRYNKELQKAIQPLKFSQSIQYHSESKTLYSIVNNKGVYRVDSLGNTFHFIGQDSTTTNEFNLDKNLRMDTIRNDSIVEYSVNIDGDFEITPFYYKTINFPYYQILKLGSKEGIFLKKQELYYYKNNTVQWSTTIPFIPGILNYKDGIIYFPTIYYKGLISARLEDIKRNKFHTILPKTSSAFTYFDKNEDFWICSLTDGILYIPNDNIFTYANQNLPKKLDLRSIYKSENQLFISDNRNNVFSFNLNTFKISQYPQVPKKGNNPNDLFYDKKNKSLYYGSYIFKDNKWVKLKSNYLNYVITGHSISQINQDSTRLFVTGKNSFGVINLEKKYFEFLSNKDSDYSDRTLAVFEDNNRQIWIGNVNGLFKWNNKKIEPVDSKILNSRVEDIKQLNDSTLVIATKGEGVILFDGKSTLQITKKDGLSSDLIENIAVDKNGNIWAGTMSGLNIINMLDNGQYIIENITIANGLPTNEIHKIIPGDTTWIATSKGLAYLIYDFKKTDSKQPKINAFYVNDILHKSSKTFNHNQNNILFKYATIDYKLKNKKLYRYRLQPISENWIQTQNRQVHFLGLAPNQYNFEIQSKNSQNTWSSSTSYEFTISKPFWQWWITRIIFALLLVGIILWYLNKIKKENELNRKVHDLEKQALQAQINPHFIFNVLNAIQSSMLQNNLEEASKNLSRFAKLIRTTLHFVTSPFITLEDEISSLENYLSIEQMRFENAFKYSISIDPTIVPYDIEIPPMIIQPFVENAVQHGIDSMQEKGIISIKIKKEENYVVVNITDNGKGISNSLKSKKDDKHVSVGMSITNRRLQLINDDKDQTHIFVDDAKNENGTIIGTIVILNIQIKK